MSPTATSSAALQGPANNTPIRHSTENNDNSVLNLTSPTTKQEVDALLKKKRKIREPRACYPCRQRKVKCDSQTPCKTCKARGHPDICSFTPTSKRVKTEDSDTNNEGIGFSEAAAVTGISRVSISGEEWDRLTNKLNLMEKMIIELKEDMGRVMIPSAFHQDGSDHTQFNNTESPPDTPLSHSIPARNSSAANADHSGSQSIHDGPKFVKAMEMSEHNGVTGESVHLGGGSVPALVMALQNGTFNSSSATVKEVFGNGVLPLFGLDNENVTYPFVSLWGSPPSAGSRIIELSKAMPSDAECLELFQQYRAGAYMTYPAIVDIDHVEAELYSFLANRRSGTSSFDLPGGATSPGMNSMYGKAIQFGALLYAAFASGAQFSDQPRADREMISQVYVCCSFECLRLVNYLSNVTLEVIQTLLVLGNVLSNAMNPGASWALLGMTLRLAQAVGLHRSSEVPNPTPNDIARAKTWWAVLWQDSLLAQSFDRPTTFATDHTYPPLSHPKSEGLSFREVMYRIRKVGLDTVQNRVAQQSVEARLGKCLELRAEIAEAYAQSAPHLQNLQNCRNTGDESEYWQLMLHVSYMNSELCRPAISPSLAQYDRTGELRRLCISELMKVAEAFLGLSEASPIHLRSWAITHRGLSSGLLLGILGEPTKNERAHTLLRKMRTVILESGQFTRHSATSSEPELSAPLQRSVKALSRLTDPGTCTPYVPDAPGTSNINAHTQPSSLSSASTGPANNIAAASSNMRQSSQERHDNHMSSTGRSTGMGTLSRGNSTALFTDSGLPNVMMNFDDTDFYLPSPLTGFIDDETSPHAVMNSIIFGGEHLDI